MSREVSSESISIPRVAPKLTTSLILLSTIMIPGWLSIIASVGMAFGPPLVYADQTISIVKKKYASMTTIRS